MARTKSQQAQNTQKTSRTKKGYKRGTMVLSGEHALNIAFKLIFGFLFFWLLFYPMFISNRMMDLTGQISYIILFTIISNLMAVIVSYVLILIITWAIKRPKKGFFSINKLPKLDAILFDMVSSIFNAFFIAAGLVIFLTGEFETWEHFMIIYLIIKCISMGLAFVMVKIFEKNIFFVITVIAAFILLLSLSIIDIINGGVI